MKVYSKLSAPEVAVARSLGITEAVMVGLMTGRPLRNKLQLQPVLSRYYLALVLFDLWNAAPIHSGTLYSKVVLVFHSSGRRSNTENIV